MLIVKGHRVDLTLARGGHARGRVLLHDPTGQDWPSSSGLIVRSITRLDEPCDDADAASYFGSSPARRGSVRLPAIDLDAWSRVGAVKSIRYTRRGDVDPDTTPRKSHVFGETRHALTWGPRQLPVLYRRGGAMRLELAAGTSWDWRGIDD